MTACGLYPTYGITKPAGHDALAKNLSLASCLLPLFPCLCLAKVIKFVSSNKNSQPTNNHWYG